MPKSKKVTRTRVSKRTVKPIKRSPSKRVSKKVQSLSTKIKNYEEAYKACVEKALSTCAKRTKMVENKKSRKPIAKKLSNKPSKKVEKNKPSKKVQKMEKPEMTYRQFVSEHMHDEGIKDKPVTERVVIIAKMWNKHKQTK